MTIKDLKVGEIQKNTIMWVATISPACYVASVMVVVEDKDKKAISLNMYDDVTKHMKFEQLSKVFPEGLVLGIKQPLLMLPFGGGLWLRNDNPDNIVMKHKC